MCVELVSASSAQANHIPAFHGQKESLVLRLWKNDSLVFWGSQEFLQSHGSSWKTGLGSGNCEDTVKVVNVDSALLSSNIGIV